MLIQAALNGGRSRAEHPAVPLTADEIGADARRVAGAGAGAVHVHPRDGRGTETLDPRWCDAAVEAIRAAAPGLPVGLTTGAWIGPDPSRRLQLIAGWRSGPDFASVNLSEEDALEVCGVLASMGVGIEAGLVDGADAERLVASGWAERCVRILLEPQGTDDDDAAANAAAMEGVLAGAGVAPPRLWHGDGAATWAVVRAGLAAGADVRVGLEDVLTLPEGSPADGNAALVAGVVRLRDERR
jgi:uncharacterized protein (DUF849 family)